MAKVSTKSEADRAAARAARAEDFRRIGNRRLPAAVKAVRMLGNLGAYPHDEAQSRIIVEELLAAVAEVERRLNGTKVEQAVRSL
jgi:hypothetical protein